MRISDWSSDVCSSDLHVLNDRPAELPADLEILRLDLARTAAEFFERRRGAHALVGIVDEGFTVKFVGARARHVLHRDEVAADLPIGLDELRQAAHWVQHQVVGQDHREGLESQDRKSTRLNSSPQCATRIPSTARKTTLIP